MCSETRPNAKPGNVSTNIMSDKIRLLYILLGLIVISCSSNRNFEKTVYENSTLDNCKLVKQLLDKNNFDFPKPSYATDNSRVDLERRYINQNLIDDILFNFPLKDKATIQSLLDTKEIKQIETFGRKCVLFQLKSQGFYPFNSSTSYLLFHDHRDSNAKECFFIQIHDKILYRQNIDSNWIYFRGKNIWRLPEC